MEKDKHVIEVEICEDTPESKEAVRQRVQREQRQHELLMQLVEDEILPTWAVVVMIEVGIISLDDDLLPCEQMHRRTHWTDYDSRVTAYRERRDNPPPPPEKPMDQMQRWLDQKAQHPPDTGEICCPIQGIVWDWEEQPPVACVEARKCQHDAKGYKENPEKQALLDDPADPINEHQLRPCVVLGRGLRDSIFVTLALKRRDAEARRWPAGKPKHKA